MRVPYLHQRSPNLQYEQIGFQTQQKHLYQNNLLLIELTMKEGRTSQHRHHRRFELPDNDWKIVSIIKGIKCKVACQGIKKPWNHEERQQLLDLHYHHGNNWDEVMNSFPSHSEASVKVQFAKLMLQCLNMVGDTPQGKRLQKQSIQLVQAIMGSSQQKSVFLVRRTINQHEYRHIEKLLSLMRLEQYNSQRVDSILELLRTLDRVRVENDFELPFDPEQYRKQFPESTESSSILPFSSGEEADSEEEPEFSEESQRDISFLQQASLQEIAPPISSQPVIITDDDNIEASILEISHITLNDMNEERQQHSIEQYDSMPEWSDLYDLSVQNLSYS